MGERDKFCQHLFDPPTVALPDDRPGVIEFDLFCIAHSRLPCPAQARCVGLPAILFERGSNQRVRVDDRDAPGPSDLPTGAHVRQNHCAEQDQVCIDFLEAAEFDETSLWLATALTLPRRVSPEAS